MMTGPAMCFDTPQQHTLLAPVLESGERSVSRCGRLIPCERAPGTDKGFGGHRSRPEVESRRKIAASVGD
jgi:hypothetical protein